MDSYIQILCRFQKCKQKVLHRCSLKMKSHPLRPQRMKKKSFFGGVNGDFSLMRSNGGGTFRLHCWNLHKIWIQESIDLNSVRFR